MYDKSKKTWSQRLKITKSEKSSHTATESITTTAAAAAVATNNANIIQRQNQQTPPQPQQQYQQQQQATMHLPTALQLQQLSDYHNSAGGGGGGGGGGSSGIAYEYLPSALSRSMKYSEPWIYGTVRGIPARPYHHHYQQLAPGYGHHPHAAAIFAAHPLAAAEALAVVICSCPEYLSGTKRDVKKASVCKKCKGSRLPLATIGGGTVRLQSSSGAVMTSSKLRPSGASTMRVVSTSKKSRPTILDPQKDPYDLMRRTRLLSPEPGLSAGSSKQSSRNRGKSASPTRGRSRTRGQLPTAPTTSASSSSSSTKKNAARVEAQDCWLVEDTDSLLSSARGGSITPTSSNNARRSILRCNVNPYDLISIKSTQSSNAGNNNNSGVNTSTYAASSAAAATAAASSSSSSSVSSSTRSTPSTPPNSRGGRASTSQNEFMPPNDDFNVEDAELYEEAPPFATSSNLQQATSNPKSSKSPNSLTQSRTSTSNAETGIASAHVGGGNAVEASPSKLNYSNIQAIAGQRISLGETKSTRKSLIKQSADGCTYESFIIGGDEDERDNSVIKRQSSREDENVAKHQTTESHAAEQPKRPARLKKQESLNDTELEKSFTKKNNTSTHTSTDEERNVTVLTMTPTPQHIKSILKRPSSKTCSDNGDTVVEDCKDAVTAAIKDTAATSTSSSTTTPTNQRRGFPNSPTVGSGSGNGSGTVAASSPTAQFYIPLPQAQAARKKVQFMVENNEIHECNNTNSNSNNNSTANCNTVVSNRQQDREKDSFTADEERQDFSPTSSSSSSSDDFGEVDDSMTNSGTMQRSTSNYEYYNRKREQQKLLLQQQAAAALALATATGTVNANPMGTMLLQSKYVEVADVGGNTQAAILAKLQHDSDLVSYSSSSSTSSTTSSSASALTAMDSKISGSSCNSNNNSSNNVADAEHFNASAEIPLINFKASDGSSLHHEDVIPVQQKQQQQQQQQTAAISTSKNSSSPSSNRIMSDTSTKLLLALSHAQSSSSSSQQSSAATLSTAPSSAPEAAAAATTTTSSSKATPPPATKTTITTSTSAAVSHVIQRNDEDDADADDDDDDNDDGEVAATDANVAVPKAKHAAATTTSTKPGDYDDDAKLQALVASDSSSTKSRSNSSSNDDQAATQSRNPIRRSHSERQPSHNKLTPASVLIQKQQQQRSSSSNNNNNDDDDGNRSAILNFKDTMALRIKSNRNDARDLFARNSTGAALSLATTTTAMTTTTTALNSMSRPREPPPPPPPSPPTPTAAATAEEFSTTTTKSNSNALSLLSPAGPAAAATQTAADKDKNATAAVATATNGLDNRRQQQQQELGKGQGHTNTTHNQRQRKPENNGVASCQEINNANNNTKNNGSYSSDNQDNSASNMHEQQKHQPPPSLPQQQHVHERAARPTTIHGITSTPRMNQITPQQQQQQRTVVRVAPFNKTTSEVHRLKISHTDDIHNSSDYRDHQSNVHYHNPSSGSPMHPSYTFFQYNTNSPSDAAAAAADGQKKTSILINGDDCYSTMNLSCDASTPRYQSSVVVADYSNAAAGSNNNGNHDDLKVTNNNNSNTVTINVSSPRSAEEELIYQHNKINTLLSRQSTAKSLGIVGSVVGRAGAIIPIRGMTAAEVSLQRSASSTSSTSTSSMTSISSSGSGSAASGSIPKRGRTLIRLDYDKEKQPQQQQQQRKEDATVLASATTTTSATITPTTPPTTGVSELLSHEQELLKILRNPVEAVKRNLVPHVCGRNEANATDKQTSSVAARNKKMKEVCVNASNIEPKLEKSPAATSSPDSTILRRKPTSSSECNSFITKLLEDPTLSQVADGLETDTVAELIENSLKRLKESRSAIDISGTKDSDDMNRLINLSLQKIKEERQTGTTVTPATSTYGNINNSGSVSGSGSATSTSSNQLSVPTTKDEDRHSNRGSISSANSFASASNYEMFDFDANESDCYQSCSSEITSPGGDDDASSAATRSKFYQMLVDATLAEIEMSTCMDGMEEDGDDEHHYESIRNNGDPIYEEITDMPPPLPLTGPPLNDPELDKKAARSIFEGASKYDILSYLVDAKERGVVREEPFEYPINCSNPIIIEEEACDTLSDLGKRIAKKDNMSSRASVLSDSSEDTQSTMSSLSPPPNNFIYGGTSLLQRKGTSASEIERNDSGVGSETSKSSRSKYQNPLATSGSALLPAHSPIHLCEDCDGPVETQVTDSGVMFAPLVCRKCGKKRVERKEIITEIVETEEKYGRDLQIILEEFCHPMLVAGLLTQEQLSAIFLNTEELLENNQTLAERMRDSLDIALEQGDDDLLTVNIGKTFLDFTQMLHAFESYCVRQAGASLLLANLEKEKELLRIFLKVSQMENAVLRRMNLNSFLMVPVQRVTKYPLLLARLYKVTPAHLEGRDLLKQAQEKIELHLNHINQEAKDVPTKLWRRISSSSPNRRASCEIDMINIKLRKMAIDILEWNHDEVRFAMEGKLLYTQPTDSNWKKARTIKLTPVNALLVTNGKPSANYKAEKVMSDKLNFPKHTGIREASLLVVKEKCGRYTLIREPLYLDRCVVCSEADWDDYFEVQEISSKDTFIFKAEDGVRTKQWYTQLQYHAQGMGAWRKRRNALANIMINGMLARS